MIEFIKQDSSKSIIIFIHGLFGGKTTWMEKDKPSMFVQFLIEDENIKKHYDAAIFSYHTNFTDRLNVFLRFSNLFRKSSNSRIRKNLKIEQISKLLSSEIDVKLKEYENIVLIAHSMGGIISKSYILQSLDKNKSKVKLYFSLAVPHNGSDLATIGKVILKNPQIKDLAPIGEKIVSLNEQWIKKGLTLPITVYFKGLNDTVVSETSSSSYDARDIEPIFCEHDHSSIIRPENKDDIVISEIKNKLNEFSSSNFISVADVKITDIRFRSHIAHFVGSSVQCLFLNFYNESNNNKFTITHIWIEIDGEKIYFNNPLRLLPRKLNPQDVWETWIDITQFIEKNVPNDKILSSGRAWLADGHIIISKENKDIPAFGSVPNGGEGLQ